MASIGDSNRILSNPDLQRHLQAQNEINQNLGIRNQRLASGKRINSAEDDPAGFYVGQALQSKTRGLATALNNIGDARSTLTVAEGGATQILDILETIKEKAIRAGSPALNDDDKQAINDEIQALADEIDSIVDQTEFNGNKLLSGAELNIQTGTETTDTVNVEVTSASHDSASLGVENLDVTAGVSTALSGIDGALATVKGTIASLGASQSRLSSKEGAIADTITNTEAARSRITDADFAREQLAKVGLEVQQQASAASGAHAHVTSDVVSSLL